MRGRNWRPKAVSRFRSGHAVRLVVMVASVAIAAGCDPGSEHFVVKNECSTSLLIYVAEDTDSTWPDDLLRTTVTAEGVDVKPGGEVEQFLTRVGDGFRIAALDPGGALYSRFVSVDEPQRSFTLSDTTGSCPQ